MNKIYTRLLVGMLFVLGSLTVNAQYTNPVGIPIAYWDFESNAARATTYETTVEQALNSGCTFDGKIGGASTATCQAAGNGVTYAGSAGSSMSAGGWSTVTTNPGVAATTYYQFTVNTTGFSTISFLFDRFAGSTSLNYPNLGVLASYDGGTVWNALGTISPTNNVWGTTYIALAAGANNISNLKIRIYGYFSNNSAGCTTDGFLRLDNLAFFGASTVAGAGVKTTMDEGAFYTSYTSGLTGSLYARNGFTVDGAGAEIVINNNINPGLYLATTKNLVVSNNATLTFGNFATLSGAATTAFTLNSGCTLKTANTGGIAPTGVNTGSIIVTSTKTYNAGANYVYTGSAAQVTGLGLPTTLTGNLTINNSAGTASTGVSLSQATSIGGIFTLTNGVFTTTTNLLSVTNTATGAVVGGSTSTFVNGPLKWSLPTLAAPTSYIFPVGKGGVYLPMTLIPSSTTTPAVTVQAFNTGSGGAADCGTTGAVSGSEYWSATINSGTWTDGSVSLTRQSALGSLDRIGRSATQTGTYVSLGGTVAGTSINNSTATGAALGFFAMAGPTPPAPTITSLGTSSGCPGGSLTINGTDLLGATAANVTIGGTPVASITSNSGTVLVVVTGAGTTGTVSVTTCGGTATSGGTYTFNPASDVSNFSSAAANTCIGSGSTVTVSSTSLASGTYTVTYNVSGTNTVASTTAPMVFTAGAPGTGTFTTANLPLAGAANVVNITAVQDNSLSCSSAVSSSTAAFTTTSTTTWTGGTSTDWATGSNWSCGTVPTAASDVIIGTGTFQPIIGAAALAKTITLNTGTTLDINNTLTVAGNWTNNGSTVAGSGTVIINATSIIAGTASTTFPNLTITGAVSQGVNTSVTGNYNQTAGSYIVTPGTVAYTLTIGGTFGLSGGDFVLTNNASAPGITTVTVTGATTVSGTARLLLETINSTTGSSVFNANGDVSFTSTGAPVLDWGIGANNAGNTFNVKGNFSKSGTGTFQTGGTGPATGFVFNKTGVQTFSYAGANSAWTSYNVSSGSTLQMTTGLTMGTSSLLPASVFTVNSGGILDAQASVIAGSSTTSEQFILSAGATLVTANANGIVSGTTGTISTTVGTRTFNAAANYEFNRAGTQTTNFGTTTMNNLIISGTNTKTQTAATAIIINGDLTVNTGATFAAGANTVTLGGNFSNAGTYTHTAANSFVFNKNGDQAVSGAGSFTFPVVTLNKTALANKVICSSTVSIASGGIVYTNGTWEQSAGTMSFTSGNQTMSSATGKLMTSGTGSITFPSSAIVSGGALQMNSSGTMTIGTATGNSLQISAGTVQFTAGTVNVAARIGGATNLTTGGALTLDGATVNVPVIGLSNGTAGTFAIASATTFAMSSGTLNILQANQGAFAGSDIEIQAGTISGGSIVIGSASPGATDFLTKIDIPVNNLTNNTGAVKTQLVSDLTLGNTATLTMTSGNIDARTNAKTVYVSNNAAGAVSYTAGMVDGNLKRAVATTGVNYLWPVGFTTNYTPATYNFTNLTAGDLNVIAVSGDEPNLASSAISSTKDVNVYWTTTATNSAASNDYNGNYAWPAALNDAGVTAASFIYGKYSGAWTYPAINGTPTTTTLAFTGANGFSNHAIGNCNTVTSASVGGNQPVCQGGTSNGLGGNAAVFGTGTWTVTGVPVGGNASDISFASASTANTTATASASAVPGDYTLTWTISYSSGPCSSSSNASLTLTVTAQPTATAGGSANICQDGSYTLTGGEATSSNGSVLWTHNGAGSITNATTLTPTYTAAAGDAGNAVTLTLKVSNAPCTDATAVYTVNVSAAATANANSDQVVCASSPDVTLNGIIGGAATSATWSGGAGTFTPNNTTLNAVYTPTAGEISTGSVTLTLTTDDPTGPCIQATDVMTITINPAATANANSDQIVCASSPDVTLNGSYGGAATSASWSGGAGTFTPDNTTMNAVYTPTAGEISTGSVTLTLTTDDPAGPCIQATDAMTITINPVATADAGSPQTVCAGNTITLNGSFGGAATSASWSGGAGTFTPNANAVNAVYTPTAGEITAGTVTLTLTTNDPSGPCGSANANMTITITALSGSVASANSCKNMEVGTGAVYTNGGCDVIAKVEPSGASPVAGMINTCVTLDPVQMYYNSAPYVQRHMDIEPVTNAATATAAVTLYFTDAEFVNYNTNNPTYPQLPTVAGGGSTDPNITNVKVTQYHGTPTSSPSAPGFYTGVAQYIDPVDADIIYNGSYWEVKVNVSGFSGFYVYTSLGAGPLPITINYFNGSKQGSHHLLNWKVTCNSTPRATMILERSADSRNFNTITTVVADAARCNQPFDYTDVQPLAGMNYYRLKMIDVDGKVSYSGIVALLNATKGFDIISIAPNPVVTGNFKLNVTSAQASKMDITIIDMQGRTVSRQTVSLIAGFNSLTMNVGSLAAGTYTIQGNVDEDKSRVIRFVKQ